MATDTLSQCVNTAAGVDNIQCLSGLLNYVPGVLLVLWTFLIVYFKLNRSAPREQLSASIVASTVVAMLSSAVGFLPSSSQLYVALLVLLIGSTVMLFIRN